MEMNDNYYFECNGKNINLNEYINDYNIEDKVIIYIKKTEEIDRKGLNHLKVRSKKPYDFHINYNNIQEGSFINISINISDKKNSELKDTLENIKEYIIKIVPNINIE